MLTPETIRDVLLELGLDEIEIEIETEGSAFVAIVISPSFEMMAEHERQELVWGKVLDSEDRIGADERQRLEFIFAFTPREYAELTDNPQPQADLS